MLSPDAPATQAFIERCRAEGWEPRLVRSGYEVQTGSRIAGTRIYPPTAYLDPPATDQIHKDVLHWLRALPSVRLTTGVALADWSAAPKYPSPVWGWLGPLAPHVQVCLRLVRLVRAVAEREKPVAWTLIGTEGDLVWQGVLIEEAMRVHAPMAMAWGQAPVRAAAPRPASWRSHMIARTPLWMARRRKSRIAALDRLAAIRKTRASGPTRSCEVMLISRGRRGAHWIDSRARGRPVLIDEYSEGLPDALAEACERTNGHLTLVWEGERPTVNGQGYADRWPDHVTELTSPDFGAIGSVLRPIVSARFEIALRKLFKDEGFREAFRLDGVDMIAAGHAHIHALLLNLSVLMATQTEAWQSALEAVKPDVVAAGRLESRPWINLAAARVGARTASAKLGVGDEMALSLMAVRPDGRHEAVTSPDALMLWGEYQADYIRALLPENSAVLAPLGRLRSDTFVHEAGSNDPETTRRRLGLAEEGPVLTWGGTCRTRWGIWPGQKSGAAVMSPENWRACLRALCRVAEKHGGQVLVKPHPADDLAFVRDEAARLGPVCVFAPPTSGVHNLDLLSVTSVFVSSVSSMFAEALLAGGVAVNVWTPEIAMIYETGRFDIYARIAAPARGPVAMSRVIDRLLSDPKARSLERDRALAALGDIFGPTDGLNGRRTADWLINFGVAK